MVALAVGLASGDGTLKYIIAPTKHGPAIKAHLDRWGYTMALTKTGDECSVWTITTAD